MGLGPLRHKAVDKGHLMVASTSDCGGPLKGARAEHGSACRYNRGCRCALCKEAQRVSRAIRDGRQPYPITTGGNRSALDPSDAIDLIAEFMGQS